MKLKLLSLKSVILLVFITINANLVWAQPSNLVGELFMPINYDGWVSNGSTVQNPAEVILTPAFQNQSGSIYFNQPYSLVNCTSFRVRFDFLMTGGQTFTENGITSTGDGIAFWFLENPPTASSPGSNLGMPNTGSSANNRGLKVALDIYDNDGTGDNPAVMAYWGGNFQEQNVTAKVSVPNLRSNQYQTAVIDWNNGQLTVSINGVVIMNAVSLTPSDDAENITQGYFGFSASTGLATDEHSIRNAQIFLDVIRTNDATMQGCFTDGESTGIVDMTQINVRNQIATSGNFRFFRSFNDATRNRNRISNPATYEANDNEVVYVRVENNEGCYSIATLTIDLIPVQAIIADPSNTICASEPVELDATASIGQNIVYSWTTNTGQIISGANTARPVVQGLGRYFLTITSNGCPSFASVDIGANQLTPRAEIAEPEEISCRNLRITLDGSNSASGAEISYLWNTTNGNIVSGQNTNTIQVDRPGRYELVVTDAAESCSNSTFVNVVQSADEPVASFVLPELRTCRAFEVILDGSASSSGPNFIYEWTATEGGVIVSGGDTHTATVSAEGMYTLTVTNTTNGCPKPYTQRLIADTTRPIASIVEPEILSCNRTSLLLDGRASSRGANIIYEWTATNGEVVPLDANQLTLSVSRPGTYTLTVTNTVTGCNESASVTVESDPTAIQIDLPDQVFLSCSESTTVLDASQSTNGNHLTYEWTTNNGIISGATNQLIANVSTVGTYQLTITNPAIPCSQSKEVVVVPDTSTPILEPYYELVECSIENRTGFAQFNLRSKDQEIRNGNTNWSVNYYLSDADAQNRRNRLPDLYTNTISSFQQIYVRVENNDTQCFAISNLDLAVNPLPSPRVTEPYQECDDDADGFAVFNFNEVTEAIIDNDPDVTVTYHETLENAQDNLFPLATIFTNITKDRQTVFVRAVNNRTSCPRVVSLVLEALAAPQINYEVEDIENCDEDTDGVTYFDLTLREQEVLKNIEQQNVQVQFFTTLVNAESGLNAITDVTNFRNTVTNRQTIWARATNTVTDCYRTTFFDIVAHPLPQLQVLEPVQICDNGMDLKDGIATFDLTDASSAIVNNELGYQVRLYTSQQAAEADGNDFVSETAFVNTVNPQVLYARVTNQVTECVNYGNITLRVLPNPSPEAGVILERCDVTDTGDGIEIFDLTEKEEQIINEEGGITLIYFTSEADALFNENPILNPQTFPNTERDNQIIYVRAVNNVTGCFTVVSMLLNVYPLPESNQIENLLVCGSAGASNAVFDLSGHVNRILANLNPSQDYQVTYYLNEQDANDNIRQLPDLYRSTGLVQPIWTRVEHRDSECFKTYSFDLLVGEEVVLETPTDRMIQCGNVVNGIRTATFDLTEFQATILNGINPSEVTIRYYETENLGDLTNEVLTPGNYTNTAYPQNIYVQVTRNQLPNCSSYTSFALQVNLNPIPVLVQDIPLCVNSQTNQAVNTVILNAGLLMATHDFIWERNGVVLPNETSNTIQTQEPGDYQVTAINKGTLCEAVDAVTVVPYFEPQTTVNYLTGPFTGVGSVEVVSDNPERYTYSLDGGQVQTNPIFENLEAGMHQILVTDLNGCGTQTLTFVVTDYMRYFTPNGDGYNEEWKVLGLEEHPEAEVHIFDRHGKLIKGMRADEKWNGTFNGYALPANDYWFTVQYVDNGKSIVYKSHFTLKR